MIKGVTMDNFSALGIDDKVELPRLIAAFDVPVIGRVKSRTDDAIVFVTTFAGVTLGTWTCIREGETFKWRT